MKNRFYSLREFRQILGVTAQTVRNCVILQGNSSRTI